MSARETEAAPESDALAGFRHPRRTRVLVGHGEAERALLDAHRSGRAHHAWMIGGPEGIGKATLAWRFAKFLLAHPDPADPRVAAARDLSVDSDDPDVRRVEALSHPDLALARRAWDERGKRHFTQIRIDDVRDAARLFRQSAAAGGQRVCVIDALDDLNPNGANALLKILEEPPPRATFLLVVHRPGAVLPTIRSRCRALLLRPLADDEVVRAMQGQGDALGGASADDLRAAAAASGGAVRAALLRLDEKEAAFARRVDALLDALPRIDWREAHSIADRTNLRAGERDYETLKERIDAWLGGRLRAGAAAGEGVARLAPLAELWNRMRATAREAEALNLDKKPFVLSILTDLASVARAR